MKNIPEKLEAFRALVEQQYRAQYCAAYPAMPREVMERETTVHLRPGQRWAKVDVGTSGKYMVEMTTGQILGIKAYGVPHKGHSYGTLEMTDLYDWSGYHARKLTLA